MKVRELHSWNVTPSEALDVQRRLAGLVSRDNFLCEVRTVAGVDVSVGRVGKKGRAAVVVLEYPGLTIVERHLAEAEIEFPYIPGLLSFREAPVVLQAFRGLGVPPDLVIVDGQGLAHPRRFGIAAHIGVLLDVPTIGCAKSLLIGKHQELDVRAGATAPLLDRGEVIGAAVRTKNGVKPVFVSIGHKVDLDSAIQWILNCCRGYRLPEPTRQAHVVAGQGEI